MPDGNNPYLAELEASKHLRRIQYISVWWRAKQIEQYSFLTAKLLKISGLYEQFVEEFLRNQPYESAFIEDTGNKFLNYVAVAHPHSLAGSLAKFEVAILTIRQGMDETTEINWPFSPQPIIDALLTNQFASLTFIKGNYKTLVSSQLPEYYRITTEPL